jgi:hypothetical protein
MLIDTHLTFKALHEPMDANIFCIDLGFAQTGNKSNGVIYASSMDQVPKPKSENFTFAVSIDQISERICALDKSAKVVLVIEAPLSWNFNPNPYLRGNFEKGRGWYYGPGASVCLAAHFFLSQLCEKLKCSKIQKISLVEAFLSNKPKGKASNHLEDAGRIYSYYGKKKFWLIPGKSFETTGSVLDFFQGNNSGSREVPAIINPPTKDTSDKFAGSL